MSGVGKSITFPGLTGNNSIDGILTNRAWGGIITYAFPEQFSDYGNYPASSFPYESSGFQSAPASIRTAAKFILEGTNQASVGFSLEGFTNAPVQLGVASSSTVRYGLTALNVSGYDAYASGPSNSARAGDVWLKASSHQNAVAGNKAWFDVIHETGHAIGLKHPNETGYGTPVMNSATDAMEYTVMSYKGYPGAAANFTNEAWGYAQTFMRSDIAALQKMYGADFTTNVGGTVYKWNPGSGVTLVNGSPAISPGVNKIFATIWDGGGTDTYDLSSYSTNLTVDLRPGEWSSFGTSQNAILGPGRTAQGTIYNAYLYNNDNRSLIEDAVGGSGSDEIIGNQTRNFLQGLSGNDTLIGEGDADRLSGGNGNDLLNGGTGADQLDGGAGIDTATYNFAGTGVTASLYAGQGTVGEAAGDTYVGIENLQGSRYADLLVGDFNANTLWGGLGNDRLNGAAGNDIMVGGAGDDTFVFGAGVTGRDVITDFNTGNTEDRVDLRGNELLFDWLAVLLNTYQVGANVEIRSADGDVIVINNASLSAIDQGDFIF